MFGKKKTIESNTIEIKTQDLLNATQKFNQELDKRFDENYNKSKGYTGQYVNSSLNNIVNQLSKQSNDNLNKSKCFTNEKISPIENKLYSLANYIGVHFENNEVVEDDLCWEDMSIEEKKEFINDLQAQLNEELGYGCCPDKEPIKSSKKTSKRA